MSGLWEGVTAICAMITTAMAIFTLNALYRDSESRTRPVLTAYIQRSPVAHGNQILDLVVRNSGGSTARNVSFSFIPSPILIDDPQRPGPSAKHTVKRFSREIRVFPAGTRIRNVWAVIQNKPGSPNETWNSEPLPEHFKIRIRYQSDQGKSYEDEFELDVRDTDDNFIVPSTTGPNALTQDVVKALHNIVRKLDDHG